MTAPVYGRVCVDLYIGNAAVGGVNLPPIEQRVTDPSQFVYTLVFPEVNLCRDMLNNVTAVGVTDGVEGITAIPFTMDVTDRSSVLLILT